MWRTGDRFGFIKSSRLHNNGHDVCRIALIDGLQNLMPYGATTALQTSFSNLLNAYKRNEIEPSTGLGIFALSATLTDRAEPSESLKATVAWQVGLAPAQHLLCTDQLDTFRRGLPITPEQDGIRQSGGVSGQHVPNAGSRANAAVAHCDRRQPGQPRCGEPGAAAPERGRVARQPA